MESYLTTAEFKKSLEALVKLYVQQCLDQGVIPEDFKELIKHNFYAKYAVYNKEHQKVEIGVNEAKGQSSTYPAIATYSFSIFKTDEWLWDSFKSGPFHQNFYSRLLKNKRDAIRNRLVVY